jgi:deoxyribonuclease IV
VGQTTAPRAALGSYLPVAGGLARRLATHANDSLDACDSLRDRPVRIGRGRIGLEAFSGLLAHPAVAGLPVLLETPGGAEACAEDLALLDGLRP